MDELNRCWIILGIEPGSSQETAKWAYRNLVKAWHPDLFGHDEIRQIEGQERLKEINWAYGYLEANFFSGAPITDETEFFAPDMEADYTRPATPPAETTAEPNKSWRSGLWQSALWLMMILALGGVARFFWFKLGDEARSEARKSAANILSPTNLQAQPAFESAAPADPNNILEKMLPANAVEIVREGNRVMLKTSGPRDYIRTPQPVRPPFTLRAQVRTESGDVRLYYALGIVVFNWTARPDEIRVHDPTTGLSAGASGQGVLTPGEWHEVAWDISTNAMTVTVDGQPRYQAKGAYSRLNAFPGVGSRDGPVSLRRVVIEKSTTVKPEPPLASTRQGVLGNILSSMLPVDDVRVADEPEGFSLTPGSATSPQLRFPESIRPPFVIRTRAKTDSVNLRLYYGAGIIIFNWEDNPGELRVHDPKTGQITSAAEKGRILPNDWHAIVWEVLETGMKISVDGVVRFQNRQNYHAVEGFPGIGPYLSKVTVDSFVVERK
jgi:hypothetical protein